jgi:hydroxymethylpyrimidine/phosphomethylpyrimidine kinase
MVAPAASYVVLLDVVLKDQEIEVVKCGMTGSNETSNMFATTDNISSLLSVLELQNAIPM